MYSPQSNGLKFGQFLHLVLEGTLGGLLLLMPFTGGYISGAVAALCGMVVVLFAFTLMALRKSQWEFGTKTILESLLSLPTLLLILVIIIKTLHDSIALHDMRAALQNALWTIILLTFSVLVLHYHIKEYILRVSILAIALSVFSAVNIVGYYLEMEPHILIAAPYKAIEGLLITERMVAPFGPGLNNFSCFAILGAQLNLITIWLAIRNNIKLLFLVSGLGFAICCYTVYMVQTRSGLIGVGFALMFVVVPFAWKRWLALLSCAGFIVFPAIFIQLASLNLLARLTPEILEERMARNESEFATLGGRVYIYEYGWNTLFEGKVGLWGEGIVNRDSGPAMEELPQNIDGVTFSFHNGALEILIVYGPVIGSGILVVLLAVPLFLFVNRGSRIVREIHITILGVLGALYVSSYLEAFTSMWAFWMIVLVVFSSLVQVKSLGRNHCSAV